MFLYLLITVLIVFGAALLVGLLLPKKFIIERTAEIDAPASTIWITITNHRKESEWRSNISEVSRMPARNGHAVWKEKIRNQRDPKIWETILSEPSSRLVRKLVDHKRLGGQWNYELIPGKDSEEKSRLKVRQEGEIFKPLDRFKFYIFSSRSADVNQYMYDIKQRILHMKDDEE